MADAVVSTLLDEILSDALLLARDDPLNQEWIVVSLRKDATKNANTSIGGPAMGGLSRSIDGARVGPAHHVDPAACVVVNNPPISPTHRGAQPAKPEGVPARSTITGELLQTSFNIGYHRDCAVAFLRNTQQQTTEKCPSQPSSPFDIVRCVIGGVTVFLDEYSTRTAFTLQDPTLAEPCTPSAQQQASSTPKAMMAGIATTGGVRPGIQELAEAAGVLATSSASQPSQQQGRKKKAPKLYARECLVELPILNLTNLVLSPIVQKKLRENPANCCGSMMMMMATKDGSIFTPPSSVPPAITTSAMAAATAAVHDASRSTASVGRTISLVPQWLQIILPALADPRDGFLPLPTILKTLQLTSRALRATLWTIRPHFEFEVLKFRLQMETPSVQSRHGGNSSSSSSSSFTSTKFQQLHTALGESAAACKDVIAGRGKVAPDVLRSVHRLCSERGITRLQNHIIATFGSSLIKGDGQKVVDDDLNQVPHHHLLLPLALSDALLTTPRIHPQKAPPLESWALQCAYIFKKLGQRSMGWHMQMEVLGDDDDDDKGRRGRGAYRAIKPAQAWSRDVSVPSATDMLRVPQLIATVLRSSVDALEKQQSAGDVTQQSAMALPSEKTRLLFLQARLWMRPFVDASNTDEGLTFVSDGGPNAAGGGGGDGCHSYPGCDEEVHFHRFVFAVPCRAVVCEGGDVDAPPTSTSSPSSSRAAAAVTDAVEAFRVALRKQGLGADGELGDEEGEGEEEEWEDESDGDEWDDECEEGDIDDGEFSCDDEDFDYDEFEEEDEDDEEEDEEEASSGGLDVCLETLMRGVSSRLTTKKEVAYRVM